MTQKRRFHTSFCFGHSPGSPPRFARLKRHLMMAFFMPEALSPEKKKDDRV